MIGFDLSDITNVYVGSTPQSAIYLGSLLVWPKDYSDQYLTFELLEHSQFAVTAYADLSGCNISYTADNGTTWTNILSQGGVTPTFPAGTKIAWRGNISNAVTNNTGGLIRFDNTQNVYTSGKFKVSGNPASLYFGSNTANYNTMYRGMYNNLFVNCIQLVSAKDMMLTAPTLTPMCYYNMFGGCTSLTTAPSILPATTLATSCYQAMFYGCTALTTAPELPATTLVNSCYSNMFTDCISLTTAPELPAISLGSTCYYAMFSGCSSLTTAPALPATILAPSCYLTMFEDCTSLRTAPELPAPTLVDNCYADMFSNCSSLNSITCLATDISASGCTTDWVNGVAATGIFTKASGMNNWLIDSVDGIPNGWSVQDHTQHDYSDDYLTFEMLENSIITFEGYNNQSIYYKFDYSNIWVELPYNASIAANQGDKILFKASGLSVDSTYGIGTFSSTGRFNAMGNIMSLVDGDNFASSTTISHDYQFRDLFYNCNKLIDASNLILPATTLAMGCYCAMFAYCSSLTTAPELPATTLAEGCYEYMFTYCSSLTTAPVLSATILNIACYYVMFYNCSLLNSITCLATDISATGCTYDWLNGVAASGTFTKAANMIDWTTGTDGIPSGWIAEDAS